MLTKDVIIECSARVPFPWTIQKIKKAGYNPITFLLEMGAKLERCEDKEAPTGKALIKILDDLKLFQ